MKPNESFCGFSVTKTDIGQWCHEGEKQSHAPASFFAQGNAVSLLQWGDHAKVLTETQLTPKSSTAVLMSPF